jgi:hypothetical protein
MYIYRKPVREKADDNIWTKQYFPRAHTEARKELETGFIILKANRSQHLVEREINR